MHNETWDDLRFVLAVAEAGSVNAATARLGVNHATVLRRVGAFEARHGFAIFARNATGYTVDPACRPIIEAIRSVSQAVEGVDRALARREVEVSGPLLLTTTDTLANTVLPEILPDLCTRFPDLEVEVEITNTQLNLSRLDAELTIRPAKMLPNDLVGDHVCKMGFGVYASPSLDLDDARRPLSWIGVSGALTASPIGAWQTERAPGQIVCSASSFPAMAALAAGGLGLAMLPCCIGDQTRGLRRVRRITHDLETNLWVACHADMAAVPRIARSRDVLVEGLKKVAHVIEGHTYHGP